MCVLVKLEFEYSQWMSHLTLLLQSLHFLLAPDFDITLMSYMTLIYIRCVWFLFFPQNLSCYSVLKSIWLHSFMCRTRILQLPLLQYVLMSLLILCQYLYRWKCWSGSYALTYQVFHIEIHRQGKWTHNLTHFVLLNDTTHVTLSFLAISSHIYKCIPWSWSEWFWVVLNIHGISLFCKQQKISMGHVILNMPNYTLPYPPCINVNTENLMYWCMRPL